MRIVVAEDSPTQRALLVGILQGEPDFEVVGEALDGIEAAELAVRLRPDVIAMDIEMPHLDGFASMLRIMREAPTPVVIMTSLDIDEVERSMRAVQSGALAIVAKPLDTAAADFLQKKRDLVDTLRAKAEVKVVRHYVSPSPLAIPASSPALGDVVAMAASAGGPAALFDIFSALQSGFSRSLLIVQHLSPGFVDGLARWLQQTTSIPVRVAREGERIRSRTAYLAPDGAHLILGPDGRVALEADCAEDGYRPSASKLFASTARSLRDRACAIVLTGMGEDGLSGLRAIRSVGGTIIAQDESSSVVYGMAKAAVRERLASAVLPLHEIAVLLNA